MARVPLSEKLETKMSFENLQGKIGRHFLIISVLVSLFSINKTIFTSIIICSKLYQYIKILTRQWNSTLRSRFLPTRENFSRNSNESLNLPDLQECQIYIFHDFDIFCEHNGKCMHVEKHDNLGK